MLKSLTLDAEIFLIICSNTFILIAPLTMKSTNMTYSNIKKY